MPVALLLAAGFSTRFAGDKLLAPLPDGRPLALATAVALGAAGLPVSAVLRPEQSVLQEILRAAAVQVVIAPDAAQGIGASLAAGVRATADADGWLVCLADMPYIRPATYAGVAALLAAGAPLAAPVCAGRRGHPVGFSREFGTRLAALDGDIGARALVEANRHRLHVWRTDDSGILADIDRPADLPGRRLAAESGVKRETSRKAGSPPSPGSSLRAKSPRIPPREPPC